MFYVIELGKFATALKDRIHHKALVQRIARLKALYSILTDLAFCRQSLEELGARAHNRQYQPHPSGGLSASVNEHESMLDRALALNAIIYYCRATEPYGGRGFDLESAYDLDQRGSHNSIVKLRNKQIAHFDNVSSISAWAQEGMMAIRPADKNEFTVMPLVIRANYKSDDLNSVYNLSGVLIKKVYGEYISQKDFVETALNGLSKTTDPDGDAPSALAAAFMGHVDEVPEDMSEFILRYLPA